MKQFRSVLAVVLCLLTLTLFFAGCSKPEKPEEQSSAQAPVEDTSKKPAPPAHTAKECAEAAAKAVKLPEMIEAPKRAISSYYGIEPETLFDYCALVTSSGATADEIAVFIAKDTSEAQTLLTLLQQRKEDQIQSFTGYVDSEVPRLEKAKIGSVGTICYFICSDDPTACETALKNLLA